MSSIQVQALHETPASVKRVEDIRLLKGIGSFVDDLHPENVGFMGIVRSSYARARIRKIDLSRAKDSPDFIDAITGKDLENEVLPLTVNQRQKQAKRYHLAIDETRYVGEAIVAFAATNRYAIEDILELVEIDYEPLAPILSIEDAKRNDSKVYSDWDDNIVFQQRMEKGDAEKAVLSSKHTIRARIGIERQSAVPMEPRSVVAYYNKELELYNLSVTTQSPHRTRDNIASELQLQPNKIRVIVKDMGGGFGSKGAQSYPEQVLACLLSKKTGMAIKWTSSRTEDLFETAAGRDIFCDIELSCDENGIFTAIRARNESDAGVSGTMSLQLNNSMKLIPGVYKVPNLDLQGVTYVTNKAPVGPLRGAGRPEGCFFIERAIDILAEKISMDPADLRSRNLIPPNEMPYETGTGCTYDSGNFPLLLEKLLKDSDYERLKRWRDDINGNKKNDLIAGVGLCVQVEDTGVAGKESARVGITTECKIHVWTGSSPHGQGLETTFAQLATNEFGVPLERVTVLYGDSNALPWGIGTFGSRSLSIGGSALVDACRKVKIALVDKASEITGIPKYELAIEKGQLVRRQARDSGRILTTDLIMSLPSLVEKTGEVEASSDYVVKGVPFASAAQLCALTIDRRTGMVHIEKYFAIDDCGVPINPMIVAGQLHGGIIHGVGGSLYEKTSYNNDGQLLTTNFIDYTIPTAVEVPDQLVLNQLETPSPLTLHGGKGVGETGTIGAFPAIFNAINDAIKDAGSEKELNIAPVFPEAILRALNNHVGASEPN